MEGKENKNSNIIRLKECLMEPLPVVADDYTFLYQLARWLGEVHGHIQTNKVRERLIGIATASKEREDRLGR